MAGILRGDAVSLRRSLDQRFAAECRDLLHVRRPNYLMALIAIAYGNTFRATDVANAQSLQAFPKSKLGTTGCITLFNLSSQLSENSLSGVAVASSGTSQAGADRTVIAQAVSALVRVPSEANFVLAIIELHCQAVAEKSHLLHHISRFFANVLRDEARVSEQVAFAEPISADLCVLVEVRLCLTAVSFHAAFTDR